MKISQIDFKAKAINTRADTTIKPSEITIFVGPNNSGKSLALREINAWLNGDNIDTKVIKNIHLTFPKYQEIENWLVKLEAVKKNEDNIVHLFRPSISNIQGETMTVNLPEDIQGWLKSIKGNEKAHSEIRKRTLKWATFHADGDTRLHLTDQQEIGNLQEAPANHLVKIFRNPNIREEWRRICNRAFPGMYAVIDHTDIPYVKVRMSKKHPFIEQETGMDEEAAGYHREALAIEELGDGVRSFSGLASVISSFDWKYLLVDDPEAYLHPPVAKKLGQEIARKAIENDAQVFVSTHSSFFIQGCLDISNQVTIVRLTYDTETGKASANTFEPSMSEHVFANPLLKSTRIYEALFHNAVIITEGETDRVFFEETNQKLAETGGRIEGCLIVDAHTRSSIHILAKPLFSLGIPTAAIADLDFLFDNQKDWKKLLESMNISQPNMDEINNEIEALKNLVYTEGFSRDDIKIYGFRNLSEPLILRFWRLLEKLGNYGIFCIPVGEMESFYRDDVKKVKGKYKQLPYHVEYLKSLDIINNGFDEWSPFQLMGNLNYWLDNKRIIWYYSPKGEDGQELPALGARAHGQFRQDAPMIGLGDFSKMRMIPLIHDNHHAKMELRLLVSDLMENSGGTIFIGTNENGQFVGLEKTMRNLNISSQSKLLTYFKSLLKHIIGPNREDYWSIELNSVMDVPYIEIKLDYFDEFVSEFL